MIILITNFDKLLIFILKLQQLSNNSPSIFINTLKQLKQCPKQKFLKGMKLLSIIFKLNHNKVTLQKNLIKMPFKLQIRLIFIPIQLIKIKRTFQFMRNITQKESRNSQKISNQEKRSHFSIEFVQFIKQDERCNAMNFNKNNSIFIASCGNFVKVFSFSKGALSFLQSLKHNKFSVTFSSFVKNSQYLMSSCDQIIKFWSMNGVNNQKYFMKIKEIDNNYSCFAISDKNQLIVVGVKKRIQFFYDDNQWNLYSQIENHDDWIYHLSFNESENKLISCGGDYKISIMQNYNRLWKIIQIINVDGFGNQAAFIGDNTFIFHPWCSQYMFQFKYQSENNQIFSLSNSILLQSEGDLCNLCFSQYIKQKQLFIKQDMSSILFYLVNENQELQFQQQLIFQSRQIQISMSNDGKYLISWDEATRNIQVISIDYH